MECGINRVSIPIDVMGNKENQEYNNNINRDRPENMQWHLCTDCLHTSKQKPGIKRKMKKKKL